MRQLRLCCICLLAFLLATSGALAEETTFERLCREEKVVIADAQAWLEIPGTNVFHPVMQHAQDDAYYLDHDAQGNSDNYGALYTESVYNTFGFDDPVTVIYGHRMNNGSMFGTLQKYYSGNFEKYRSVYLHMPDGERREYTVFAAVIQSNLHILHYNNFYSPRVFTRYFNDVYSTRKLGIVLDEQMRPQPGDKVIILSTCIKGDSNLRYLVMAKLNENQ